MSKLRASISRLLAEKVQENNKNTKDRRDGSDELMVDRKGNKTV